jgi:iron(III) transport system substrate-binding protein
MNRLRSLVVAALVSAGWFSSVAALGQTPVSIEKAIQEGKVVVYGATDQKAVAPLIKDFETIYPGVKVEYHDMNSSELYNRFISESAAGASADVTWSSAMDLQVKLVNDGFAQPHKSAETAALPSWAVWKNEAFGTTYEPIVIVYNKRLVEAGEVPQNRADLIKLLKEKGDKFKGKINTYDPEKSGLGFLLHSQDAQTNSAGFWELVGAMGTVGLRVQSSTGTMMERIGSGENLLGYNLLGSYAHVRAQKDASIGMVMLKDYTLVVSRVAFLAKNAPHPNAGHLWLDYLLSKRGQEMIASKADLFAIRDDVQGDTTAAGLKKQLGNALKPIPIGPSLLTYLDQAKRLEFLKQWNAAKGAK